MTERPTGNRSAEIAARGPARTSDAASSGTLRMSRLAQLQRLLAADPTDAFVLYGLAQEHAKSGDHAAAVGFYDRCIAADRAYCYAYFHKARSLQAVGRVDEARTTLAAGIDAARRAGDAKALSEMESLRDSL